MNGYQLIKWLSIALVASILTVFSFYSTPSRTSFLKSLIIPKPGLSNRTKSLCSFQMFKAYLTDHPGECVSGEGKWTRLPNGKPDRFHPDICLLRSGPKLSRRVLLECFQRHKFHYIVLMGDSNGVRMFKALKKFIEGTEPSKTINCTVTKTEPDGFEVRKWYYAMHNISEDTMITHNRDCYGCINSQFECTFTTERALNETSTVIVEHLGLEFTIDAEISTHHFMGSNGGCPRIDPDGRFHPCLSSATSQQFLLKEYFANKKPDLLLIFGSCHDSFRFTLAEHTMNLQNFADMLDVYLPPSTRIVWLNKSAVTLWNGAKLEASNMTILEWTDIANKIMCNKVRDRFLMNSKPLLFLDVMKMGMPVIKDWMLDGVHMDHPWYDNLMSYLMQTICASDFQ